MSRARPTVRRCDGFTLLELLLVLFIMGLMAATASVMLEGNDEQSRYDETRRRLEMVKRAVAGNPTRTVNGGAEISGFVADMGRLPRCLRELLDGKCADADPSPPEWAMDPVSRLWSGWHGPYLDVLPDSDGVKRFRDGWGSDDGENSYGWKFEVSETGDTLLLQSYGADGTASGDDYPPSGNLLEAADHLVQLDGWETVTVRFTNASTTTALPTADTELRLSIFPMAWPATEVERDAAPYLSDKFTLTPIASGGSVPVPVPHSSLPFSVPWGERTVIVVCESNGNTFDGDCDDNYTTSSAYHFTLVPRMSNPPVAPDAANPLMWTIGTP